MNKILNFEVTKGILKPTALVLLAEGLLFLINTLCAILYNEPVTPFLFPAICSLAIGGLLFRNKWTTDLHSNRGRFIQLILVWIVAIFIGILPYKLSGTTSSFIDAFFESTSGFTTTGFSVIENINSLPKSILLWRSLTHWLGGLGTLSMFIFLLSKLTLGNNKPLLFLRGIKDENIDNQRIIFRKLIGFYVAVTLLLETILLLGGMKLFTSICYSLTTVSSGCFIPDTSGPAGYSLFIQYTLSAFMLLSGIGYFILLLPLTKKTDWGRNRIAELRTFIILVIVISIVVCAALFTTAKMQLRESLRTGMFQVISFASGTGFTVNNFFLWPRYLLFLLLLLPLIGGCSGSLSGGIKVHRFLVLKTEMKNALKEWHFPQHESNEEESAHIKETTLSALVFITLLLFVTVLGVIALCSTGISPERSWFYAVSSLTTTGNTMPLTDLGNTAKAVMSLLMLAGRLEIYPLLVLFFPSFYVSENRHNKTQNAIINKVEK
jgi:trk system potassium uptake protein